jgi:prevent-host-death family protein
MKSRLASLIAELEADGIPLYIVQHGKPKAVLVKYEDYEAILEKMDDLEDALAMREAVASADDESMSLEEYESRRATPLRS